MKHFKYSSKDIYTFENLDDLKRELKFDNIGQVNIKEQEQLIEYIVNREKFMRLSDLIIFISNDFVRIHFGQLLILVQSLATKVQKMEENMIQHYYLDSNRIWLHFIDLDQRPSIKYQLLDYVINFTGYQCPNYEKFDESVDLKIKASKKILFIIKQIILSCYQKIILKQNQYQQDKENILNSILHNIENKNLNDFIKQIDGFLEEYQYNKQKQIINLDEDIHNMSDVRYDKQILYWLDIQKIIPQGQTTETEQQPIILEYCLYQCLPSIIQQLNSTQEYQRINYNPEMTRQMIENTQSQINDNILKFIREQVQSEIDKQIQYYQQFYKFTFKKDEITNSLTNVLNNHAILKYFNNTYTYNFKDNYMINSDNLQYQNNNLFKAMQKAILQAITLYVDDYFAMDIKIHILELIDDLI
ncbi:unnamed protein product [Paramecium sonneborni]|uniref:Uncharacterized protein n=1 Tax=Paramecium sonneborni TaxID=65129 RepID=A0A8S1RI49_9CILI|nr:unnamed protein product [Paramecium sonneborni]